MHEIKPIGIIRTPFKAIKEMPIQPKGAVGIEGVVELDELYVDGLKELDGFSHIYLIYSFHKTTRTELLVTPFLDDNKKGVFATRSPLRPNHIGISIVELKRVEDNRLIVDGVDILDCTPLLDIKPYIAKFDIIENSQSGWLQATAEEIKKKRSDNRFE